MTSCYTPAALSAYTNLQIVAIFAADGIRTGFGFYSSTTPPGNVFFVNANSVHGLAMAEGFFTGCLPKKYYSPRQIQALTQPQLFDLIRAEGVTVGDFAGGVICHAPGEAECDILSSLSVEGYQTGCPDVISAADPAFTDHACEDGRCYGTCCLAPTQGDLAVTMNTVAHDEAPGTNWSNYQEDTVVLDFPCAVRVNLFLSWWYLTGTEANSQIDIQVTVDGVKLDAPWRYIKTGTIGEVDHHISQTGFITIAANTPTTLMLKGSRWINWSGDAHNNYQAHLMYQVFKEACA